jgi:hypothetical protein
MQALPTASLEDQLLALVSQSSHVMRALEAARELRLSSWCIGAGAIRNLVWDHLHGFAQSSQPSDIDVVFHDAADTSREREQLLAQELSEVMPGVEWEVVNQAGVHHWFQSHYGSAVPPLRSLAEGVASWPEFATCVGVTLDQSGQCEVVAPHGLEDLFQMVIRWNSQRVPKSVYLERVAAKRFSERWPMVQVLPC